MTAGTAITYAHDATTERRAKRYPWGIEIQIWRLVETQTYPASAENLPVSTLFNEPHDPGAVPEPRASNPDDDVTLEQVVELEYQDGE
jgi:hypothetical protein